MRNWLQKLWLAMSAACLLAFFGICAAAQSTEQNFPTPVTDTLLNGKIAARDIGDSRLTTYFYTFNGDQGDIFLKLQTANLNGDIDIFEAETLRPISKIRVFADFSADEIVRSIYLRKPEKLILRIEGRSPNDDPATFSIRFEGSFVPSKEVAAIDTSIPKVSKKEETDTEVNSVGTIISVKPKPTPIPSPKVEIAKVEKPRKTPKAKPKPKVVETPDVEVPKVPVPKVEVPKVKKPKTVITKSKPKEREKPVNTDKPKKPVKPKAETKDEIVPEKPQKKLVVIFADGTSIEKSMKDVLKFSIERETLTIILKNGEIRRHSVSDVLKISIE